jgi:hypothetical protein
MVEEFQGLSTIASNMGMEAKLSQTPTEQIAIALYVIDD